MNLEFEVKVIIREQKSNDKKVLDIMKIATFKKDIILKALKKGGETPSDIYRQMKDGN